MSRGLGDVYKRQVFGDGAIGIEDTWVATKDGLKCLTGGTGLPLHMEW